MAERWTSELWMPCRREVLFAYLSDPTNLDRLTPPWLRIRILTPGPIRMAAGTRIDYELRLRGVPFRWQSQITRWEPPTRFEEVQTRGPFRSWSQAHVFEPREGGVGLREEMEYTVPGGRLVDRLLVRPGLERIFAYRARDLERELPEISGVS